VASAKIHDETNTLNRESAVIRVRKILTVVVFFIKIPPPNSNLSFYLLYHIVLLYSMHSEIDGVRTNQSKSKKGV
jgi:hypothetical protein